MRRARSSSARSVAALRRASLRERSRVARASAATSYYVRLLSSLLTEPANTPLVSLRSFFAELITKGDPVLADVRKLIALLDTHAETLGVGDKPIKDTRAKIDDSPSIMLTATDNEIIAKAVAVRHCAR